jgi:hypothetical protein
MFNYAGLGHMCRQTLRLLPQAPLPKCAYNKCAYILSPAFLEVNKGRKAGRGGRQRHEAGRTGLFTLMKHVNEPQAFIAHIDAQAVRHVVPSEGQRVCWRMFGRGRSLVLMHGGHGSWLHWIRNIGRVG